MKIDLEQGTKEWLDFRKDKIGASDAATIMGLNPYKTAVQLYKEKKEDKQPFINNAMRRGTELEPKARSLYNKLYRTNFEPAVFVHDEYPWLMASLDGWDNGKILELKCPSNEQIHLDALEGKIRIYYQVQMCQQLFVTGTKENTVNFGSYHEDHPFARVVYEKDQDLTDRMIKALIYFKECLDNDTPPDVEDEVTDAEATKLIEAYQAIEDAKRAAKVADEYKAWIKDHFDRPIRAKGILVSKSKTAGRVDYKKAEKDLGVDFSRWKSEPVETLRISTY